AEELLRAGDVEGAGRVNARALELGPDDVQLAFWSGLTLAGMGRLDEARTLIARARAASGRYAEMLRRVAAAGLFPKDDGLLDALLAEDWYRLRPAQHPPERPAPRGPRGGR